MKIGITGAAGLIGSHLARVLLQRGDEVIAVDNLSYGQLQNIESIQTHPHFTFHTQDILDFEGLQKKFSTVDRIVHLAALKIPRYGQALLTLKTNTEGSENVLKIAAQSKIKVVLASTSDVYGKSEALPFQENGNLVVGPPDVQRWAYAVSKMYEEQLAFAYANEYQFPVVLLRFFGGYGPHQHASWRSGPQFVFFEKALRKEPIPIHGDGQQTRTFTYVDDLVEGTIRSIDRIEANHQVLNIGNDEEITILELAQKIWRLCQPQLPPVLEFIPYNTFGKYEDVLRRRPCLAKAKEILDFKPKISLDEGLQNTFDWIRDQK